MNKVKELKDNYIRDLDEAKKALQLSDAEVEGLRRITKHYPICITPYYLNLIDKNNKDDPIRKMCFPNVSDIPINGKEDAKEETKNIVISGMQHKYRQTATILSTNECGAHCRYCSRKGLDGDSFREVTNCLPVMADYVRSHKEINNVFISGGDAFINSNETIKEYLDYFIVIPSLDFICFETCVPVVFPQRITEDEEMLRLLETYCEKKQIIIVTQFNHPREMTPEACKAVRMLRDCGCIIRNQTVLLSGVNDDKDILGDLMNNLVANGIIPYYIFQCRSVEGIKNQFQVPISRGAKLVEQARELMNGQAKSVRYVLPHSTGIIEIVGQNDSGEMIFKYHQAKEAKNQSRIFAVKLEDGQCWLEVL